MPQRFLKSEYQETPQSHTADQPTTPRGRATEHVSYKTSGRQLNQLSFPHQYVCQLERTQRNA